MRSLDVTGYVEYYGVSSQSYIKPNRWSREKYVLNNTDMFLWKLVKYHYSDGTIGFSKATIVAVYDLENDSVRIIDTIDNLKTKFKLKFLSFISDVIDALKTFCLVIVVIVAFLFAVSAIQKFVEAIL